MTAFVPAYQSGKLFLRLLACIVFAALFLYHFNPVGLGDMYWHLNTGRWIWEHGALPESDPFTYTTQINNPDPGQGTAPKNYWQLLTLQGFWLAQLLYFGAYAAMGLWGLVILKATIFVILYALLWRTMLKSRVDPLLGLLAILILPWLLFRYDELRPQVFSFVGVVLVYMNMRSAIEQLRSGSIRPAALIALPFIMMLWANLHPGYMLGWVIIIVTLAGTVFDRWRGVERIDRRGLRSLFLWCTLALIASLFNPLADVLITYLGIVQNQFAFGIDEHLPLYQYARFHGQPLLFYGVLALALIILVAIARRREHIESSQAFMLLGFTAVGFYAFRYTIFFILMALMIGMPHISALAERYITRARALLLALILVAMSGIGYFIFQYNAWKLGPEQTYYVPVHAADFVLDQRPPAPIFNAFEYGGYLGWRLAPDYPVFVDPRCLDFDVHNAYQTARGGHYQGVFAKYGVNTVVFYLRTPLVNSIPEITLYLLMDEHWDLVYVDRISAVIVRSSRNTLPAIDKSPVLNYMQRTLERTLAAAPDDTQALVQYGRVLQYRGNPDGARRSFTAALQINPRLRDARYYLDALTRQGR